MSIAKLYHVRVNSYYKSSRIRAASRREGAFAERLSLLRNATANDTLRERREGAFAERPAGKKSPKFLS
jgi:hypothetical protein